MDPSRTIDYSFWRTERQKEAESKKPNIFDLDDIPNIDTDDGKIY